MPPLYTFDVPFWIFGLVSMVGFLIGAYLDELNLRRSA